MDWAEYAVFLGGISDLCRGFSEFFRSFFDLLDGFFQFFRGIFQKRGAMDEVDAGVFGDGVGFLGWLVRGMGFRSDGTVFWDEWMAVWRADFLRTTNHT